LNIFDTRYTNENNLFRLQAKLNMFDFEENIKLMITGQEAAILDNIENEVSVQLTLFKSYDGIVLTTIFIIILDAFREVRIWF